MTEHRYSVAMAIGGNGCVKSVGQKMHEKNGERKNEGETMYEPMSVNEILQLVQNGNWTGEKWEVDMYYQKGDKVEWEDMGSVKYGKIMSYEFADFVSDDKDSG